MRNARIRLGIPSDGGCFSNDIADHLTLPVTGGIDRSHQTCRVVGLIESGMEMPVYSADRKDFSFRAIRAGAGVSDFVDMGDSSTSMYEKLRAGWLGLRARPVPALVFDVFVIAGIMFAIHAWQTRDLPLDEPAPARILQSLDGTSAQSPVEPGAVGVVYFFAPWCRICRASMGNLDELVADGTVAWASAVALDYESTQAVEQFVDDVGISMPVLLGQGQEVSDWAIRAFPTYFVIDSDGRIVSSSVGYSTGLGLRFRVWWAE